MENNPYSPPSPEDVPTHPSGANEEIVLATLGQRFCASLLDSLVIFGPLILFSYFSPFEKLNDFLLSEDYLNAALYTLLGYLIFLAINFYLINSHDQTIGKLALGIKVADMQGNSPSTANQLGVRYSFFYLISAIPVAGVFISLIDTLLIFGAQRRCLHDLLAGTQVIKSR